MRLVERDLAHPDQGLTSPAVPAWALKEKPDVYWMVKGTSGPSPKMWGSLLPAEAWCFCCCRPRISAWQMNSVCRTGSW